MNRLPWPTVARVIVLWVIAGVIAGLAGPRLLWAGALGRPNILIILADDLGFSDLGCYGGEIVTAHIDELASHGLRFTHFYNAGRGCPTRASLLTGLYPHQTGVGHMMNDWRRPGYRGNLNRQCVTIAEVLREAGYQTLMCGKWNLSRHTHRMGPRHTWPLQRGFQRFYGTIHGAGSYFDPVTLTQGDHFIRAVGDFYYTDAITDHAVQFLEEAARSEEPFFLYVAYTAPHWPLHARPEDIQMYRAKYSVGWDTVRQTRYRRMVQMGIIKRQWSLAPRDSRVLAWAQAPYRQWHQRRMEVYAAQVTAMDRGVGRIMEKVRQVGRERNTLVMFLSDNGASAEEIYPNWQGLHIPEKTRSGSGVEVGNKPHIMPGPEFTYQSYGVPWANVSNTPFRLYKRHVHEGGIATPLVVRWPAVIRRGGDLTGQIGHVTDIMATCLDVADLQYPRRFQFNTITPLEGRSLLPVFYGRQRPDRPLFWEHEGNRAVRQGQWKLVSKHPGQWELYDMEADRTELHDLAAQRPDIVRRMEAMYNQWGERCGVLAWPK